MKRLSPNNNWRTFLTVFVFATTTVGPMTRAANAQVRLPSREEQAAIEVVKGWSDAHASRDPEKVASYLAETGEFDVDQRESPKKTRTEYVNKIRNIISAGGLLTEITDVFAIGGELGTAVIVRRLDTINFNGQNRTVPIVAFFWVQNGKIQKWLDRPLVAPPSGTPGPATPPR